jgi:protein-S-isoprenylcysteine O-methyltransferase Ste14
VSDKPPSAARRLGILVAALICYLLALKPMIYFVGFLANFRVAKTIDGGPVGPPATALAVDVALVASFCVVHSVLARPRAKEWLRALVSADLERAAYSAIAGLQFVLLIALWRPLPQLLWSVGSGPARVAVWTLHSAGWAVVAAGVLSLGSARLYGLAPAWASFRRRELSTAPLVERGAYRWIRHPLYTGTLLALWAAPDLSVGRALLGTLFTVYILLGRRLEEATLEAQHGEHYRRYRRSVPAFLPLGRRR